MYTAFYGLSEKPFALAPDPRFLFLASSHREALAHVLYGIEQGEGFIAVTGEESGLLGSQYYAEHQVFEPRNTAAMRWQRCRC
jgi:hypothetical protein